MIGNDRSLLNKYGIDLIAIQCKGITMATNKQSIVNEMIQSIPNEYKTNNKQYTKIEKTIMNSLYNRMNQLDNEYKSIVNEIALCNSLVNEIKLACEQHDYDVDNNDVIK